MEDFMISELFTWMILGILAGAVVALLFPDTKKYLIGTIYAGVFGSVLSGTIYGIFKVGSEIYSHANLTLLVLFVAFSLFCIFLTSKKTA
jgi:uncharacterized membrane protein YeaQ/YmgE (transglycosylase-associated protein family)